MMSYSVFANTRGYYTGFDNVKLHRPALRAALCSCEYDALYSALSSTSSSSSASLERRKLKLKANLKAM
jgi:hypothetical protein